MNQAMPLLQEIATKARMAAALVHTPESRQALTEIRLAARCVMESERCVPVRAAPANVQRHD